MDAVQPDVESPLVCLDEVPLDQLRQLGQLDGDGVLAHALRRVIPGASWDQRNAQAAFNNYL